jgi:hypothetical protein
VRQKFLNGIVGWDGGVVRPPLATWLKGRQNGRQNLYFYENLDFLRSTIFKLLSEIKG